MASISIRLPSSVVERINLLRAERRWSLGRLIEQAAKRGDRNKIELSRYLRSYNTRFGRLRRKGRMVVNTSIGNSHHNLLIALGGTRYTKSEVAGACIRLLLDTAGGDNNRAARGSSVDIAFDVKEMEAPPFPKRLPLESIPKRSHVLVEARIIFYAFVAARSQPIKGWRSDSEMGASRQCLNLLRRCQRGEVFGFTTPGQMARLAYTMNNLASLRWASDEAKATKKAVPQPGDDYIIEIGARRHMQRVRELVKNVTTANLQILSDTADAFRGAILSVGPEDWDSQMFMTAAKQLGVDDVVLAVASPEYADLRQGAVHTPYDVGSVVKREGESRQ